MNEKYRIKLKRQIRKVISENDELSEKYGDLDINDLDTRILEFMAHHFPKPKKRTGAPKCPKCGSKRIAQYRMPTGPIWCEDCNFRVEKKETGQGDIFYNED